MSGIDSNNRLSWRAFFLFMFSISAAGACLLYLGGYWNG